MAAINMLASKSENQRSNIKHTYCSINKERVLENEDAFTVMLKASMAHTVRVALSDTMVQEVSKMSFSARNASQKKKTIFNMNVLAGD
jgi:hypothetical protein